MFFSASASEGSKSLNPQVTTQPETFYTATITSAIDILAQMTEAPTTSLSHLNASVCHNLQSQIVETSNFEDVLAHVDEGTLFVSDLDNTLIRTVQSLGSDEWSIYYQKLLETQGKERLEALQQKSILFNEIHKVTEVKLVCPKILEVFSKLKQQNCKMLGLTARNPRVLTSTLREIRSVGIEFSSDSPFSDYSEQEKSLCYAFSQGVLFATLGNKKGDVLINFLKQINFTPKKIIFIDDKWEHVNEVVETVKKEGITVIGIRYSAADKDVFNFNPLIADIQLKYFEEKILSDEEAKQILDEETLKGA